MSSNMSAVPVIPVISVIPAKAGIHECEEASE